MEDIGLKICVLFSTGERKVKNVPKYMLRVVALYLYGTKNFRRARANFNGLLEQGLSIARYEKALYCEPKYDEEDEDLFYERVRVIYRWKVYERENCRVAITRNAIILYTDRVIRFPGDMVIEFKNTGPTLNTLEQKTRHLVNSLSATVPKLKQQCRENGVRGYSRLRKAQIAGLLMKI